MMMFAYLFSPKDPPYFESKYPTDEEMERCPHVVLTSDAGWKPQEVSMHPIGNVE